MREEVCCLCVSASEYGVVCYVDGSLWQVIEVVSIVCKKVFVFVLGCAE